MKTNLFVRLTRVFLFTLASLAIEPPAFCIQPGDVDLSFNAGSGLDGTVYHALLQTNGQLVIAGTFTLVQGAVRPGLARLNADGVTDSSFGSAFTGIGSTHGIVNGGIYALAVQPDGKVLIGGQFETVNGIARTNLARLNADGTVDASFTNGNYKSAQEVDAIALLPNGKLLVGGRFTSVTGTTTNYSLVRLNNNGSVDTTFQAHLSGGDWVTAIQLQQDGTIFIGGFDIRIPGFAGHVIVHLNANGSLDYQFIFRAPFSDCSDSYVNALAVQPDGRVLVCGGFSFACDDRPGVLRLNSNGSLDDSFNHTNVDNWLAHGLVLQPDGKVLSLSGNGLKRFNADGSTDTNFAALYASALSRQPDGKLLLAGDTFAFSNGVVRYGVARVNEDGTLDPTFNPGGVFASVPTPLALGADGKALVAASFVWPRAGVSRLNPDGTLDGTFQSNLTAVYLHTSDPTPSLRPGPVSAANIQPDGKIVIGGTFDSVDGIARTNCARLNPNGGLDTNFLPRVTGQSVNAVALQADGRIIIGGVFDRVGNSFRTNIARLTTNGALDTTFQNGMRGVDRPVTGIAVQSDGKVLIAGNFNSVNGTSRTNIARLSTNGSLDTSFQPQFGNGYASAVFRLQPDGRILVGGGFEVVNGLDRTNLVRLNTDGSVDNSFLNGLGNSHQVLAIALQADGKILVGSYGLTNFSRLNADGSLDSTFQCQIQFKPPYYDPPEVPSIFVGTNDTILIGGVFLTVNGAVRPYVARLFGSVPKPALLYPLANSSAFQFQIIGVSNETMVIEGSTNLLNWIPLATNTLGSNPMPFSDTDRTNFPQRFYRARVP